MGDVLQLDKTKQLLQQYYGGQRVESPNGGFLMLLRVRRNEDGSATAIFECNVSSLRYEILIPKATRTERKKARDALKEGEDATCPRHGPDTRLVRAGDNLICPDCGVAYAKA